MELLPWEVNFKPGWDKCLKKFDKETRRRILKKFDQMEQPLRARGMHSSRYQIEEVGQDRIGFIQDEATRTKRIHFVGDHKQYEKWYKEQIQL